MGTLKRRCLAMRVLAYRELGDRDQELKCHVEYRSGLADDNRLANGIYPLVGEDISLRRPRLASFMASHFESVSFPNVANSLACTCLRQGEFEKALASVAINLKDKNIDHYTAICHDCKHLGQKQNSHSRKKSDTHGVIAPET